jgi:hypothetical protein
LTENHKSESWGPYPLILVGAAVSVGLIFLIDVRWGGFAVGAVLMLAAALRFAGYGGPLAVRGRGTDVATLGLAGFVLVLSSLLLYNNALKALIQSLFSG